MKRYAMFGTAGYVSPKHLKAIKDTGGELVCFHDPSDSVGIIDSYFPEAKYFREFERMDRELYKLRGTIDYLVICSPNYLHDAHIRYGLRSGLSVICEKPLVLNTRNLDGIQELEQSTGKKVNVILQMRLHPEIIKLKKTMDNISTHYDINLEYYTARGSWYKYSWKGDVEKSGGIATNIAIHLFDMLIYVFGPIVRNAVFKQTKSMIEGGLGFEGGSYVRYILSIDPKNIPGGGRSYRKITVGMNELDINSGFTDLHTESYKKILAGEGWGIEDARAAIEFVSKLR